MKQELDVLDPPRSQLRKLAAAVERHVGDVGSEDLKVAWLALSKALALGDEPKLRTCPNCSRRILPEATRCRYCMAQSDPSAGD
jgi:hypothetical protein